jgi:hypothetical protein
MPKRLLAVMTILALVIGMQVAELAMANPVPWQSTPNQDKPTLKIDAPENNTAYKDGSICLNFTVTKPDSWKIYMVVPYVGGIASVEAYLDGNSISLKGNDFNFFRLIILLEVILQTYQSASGLHMLNVTVLSYTYYRGPAYNGTHILSDIQSSSGPVYEYPIVVSDIVYFTVVGGPTPSPTLTPSPSPSTVAYESSDTILNQTPFMIILLFTIGAIVSFSLVYLKIRKGKS